MISMETTMTTFNCVEKHVGVAVWPALCETKQQIQSIPHKPQPLCKPQEHWGGHNQFQNSQCQPERKYFFSEKSFFR